MLASAAALGALDLAGLVTPAVLLILLCGVGVGQGLTGPIAQTLQPELVPPSERPQAIALGSVNQNLARAIGPAIGGLLLAATSAALVFFVNAASFLAVIGVVAIVSVPARVLTLPREHVRSATVAGARFVRNSPALLAIMVRAAAFAFFASGVWALLPLVARHTLGLGSGGYGLLLGAVGIGAVLGATFSPAIRRALSPRALMAVCAAAIAACGLVLAVSHVAVIDGAFLSLSGTGWILGLGQLNASFQSTLPSWVKARGMAFYTVAFQGASGTGALTLGAVAQATSLKTGLVVLAGGLVIGAAATFRLSLPRPGQIDVTPADAMPLPVVPEGPVGRVFVTASYDVAPGNEEAFLAYSDRLRHFRQRTGGMQWRLFVDEQKPGRYLETFLVASWDEHERQHDRATQHDANLLEQLDGLLVPGTHREVHHYLTAPPKSHHRSVAADSRPRRRGARMETWPTNHPPPRPLRTTRSQARRRRRCRVTGGVGGLPRRPTGAGCPTSTSRRRPIACRGFWIFFIVLLAVNWYAGAGQSAGRAAAGHGAVQPVFPPAARGG